MLSQGNFFYINLLKQPVRLHHDWISQKQTYEAFANKSSPILDLILTGSMAQTVPKKCIFHSQWGQLFFEVGFESIRLLNSRYLFLRFSLGNKKSSGNGTNIKVCVCIK